MNFNPYAPPTAPGTGPGGVPQSGTVGGAILRLQRAQRFADSIRMYRVVIDGVELSRIGDGQTVDIPLTTGTHELVVCVDWCSSQKLNLVIEPDSVIHLECGNNLTWPALLFPLLHITVWRDHYLYVRPVFSSPTQADNASR